METLETWNQMVCRVAKSTPFHSNLWPASFIRQKTNVSIQTLFSPKVFFVFNVFSTVNCYSRCAARCRTPRTPRTRATWDCRGRHGINLKKKQRKGQRHRKWWRRRLKHLETHGPVDFVQEDGEVETAMVDTLW